jgi:hypothetical protein
MNFIKKNCPNCGEEFNADAKEVKRGNGKFCTRQCANNFNAINRPKPELNVECAWCHKKFHKTISHQINSKSGLFFCCRAHKDEAQRVGGIQAIMPAHYGIVSENTYRRIAFAVKPKVCERCGYDKHEAGIIVHHKDRNRDNNDISNLEVLCAICHAIEHWEIS